jgi:hypothetical protein
MKALLMAFLVISSTCIAGTTECRITVQGNSGLASEDVQKLLVKKGYTIVGNTNEADLIYYGFGGLDAETGNVMEHYSYRISGTLNNQSVDISKKFSRSPINIPGMILDSVMYKMSLQKCGVLLKKTAEGINISIH